MFTGNLWITFANVEVKMGKRQRNRVFSEELKRELVSRYERGELSVSDIRHTYEVSETSVYKWITRYGKAELKGLRVVVEKESAEYRVKELLKQVQERDTAIGDLHMKLRYLEKLTEEMQKELNSEVKKK